VAIILIAEFEYESKEERDRVLALCKQGVADSRAEPGNHFFVHATDSLDERKLWTFQAWDNAQQLSDHVEAEHYPELHHNVMDTALNPGVRQYVGDLAYFKIPKID
jgi:quinol monooxygenase YgiN